MAGAGDEMNPSGPALRGGVSLTFPEGPGVIDRFYTGSNKNKSVFLKGQSGSRVGKGEVGGIGADSATKYETVDAYLRSCGGDRDKLGSPEGQEGDKVDSGTILGE